MTNRWRLLVAVAAAATMGPVWSLSAQDDLVTLLLRDPEARRQYAETQLRAMLDRDPEFTGTGDCVRLFSNGEADSRARAIVGRLEPDLDRYGLKCPKRPWVRDMDVLHLAFGTFDALGSATSFHMAMVFQKKFYLYDQAATIMLSPNVVMVSFSTNREAAEWVVDALLALGR